MKLRRIVTFLLALGLILGIQLASAQTASADEVYPTLVPEQQTTANIENPGDYAYFVFVPESSDNYKFYSIPSYNDSGYVIDTYGYLYDSDWNYLTSNDDGNDNLQFSVCYYLEAGQTYYFAARYYNDSYTGSFDVMLTIDHNYYWEYISYGNCVTPGIRRYTCFDCGHSYNEEFLGDHYLESTVRQAGTCAEPGVMQYTCSFCDYGYEEEYYGSHRYCRAIQQMPTCAEYGVHLYTCLTCGYSYESYAGYGHEYDRITQSQATCSEAGIYLYTCRFCDDSYEQEYYVSHAYKGEECEVCGHTANALALDQQTTITIDRSGQGVTMKFVPEVTEMYNFTSIYEDEWYDSKCYLYDSNWNRLTYDDDGGNDNMFSLTYTLTAGETYYFVPQYYGSQTGSFDVLLTVAHEYQYTELTQATCSEAGTCRYACVHCGDGFESEYYAEHSYDEEILADASCGQLGTVQSTCSVCGDWYQYNLYIEHEYMVEIIAEATCSTPGIRREYCQNCDFSWEYTFYVSHNCTYEYIVEADCHTRGVERAACADCGYYWEEIYTVSHDYRSEIIEEATCTSAGVMQYTCTFCGQIYEETYTLDHNFIWELITEGNCQTNWVYLLTCQSCGLTREEYALGEHNYVWETVAEATCVSNGRERGTCQVCGYVTEYTFSTYGGHDFHNGSCRDCGAVCHEITPGQLANVSITRGGTAQWFAYTPEQTEYYCFYSIENPNSSYKDTYGYIYTSDWELLNFCDDYNSLQFKVYYTLEAGQTYYLGARYYNRSAIGTFQVMLETCHLYVNGFCINCGEELSVQGTISDSVSWRLDGTATLTISGEGAIPDYSGSNAPWHQYSESITSLKIENGITGIGDCAFTELYSLTSVDIPGTVTNIGCAAFSTCYNLTEVKLEHGVVNIGEGAFGACYSLTEIQIPASVTLVDWYAFSGCYNLNTVIFQGDAPRFGENVFDGVSLTAYYPAGNDTWEGISEKMLGGYITWTEYALELDAPVVTASNVASTGKVKLTWDAVDGAVEYKVYRAESKNGTYKLMKTTSSTSWTHTGAVAGKTYYYYVVAVSGTGVKSDRSSKVSRTCDLARPTVTLTNVASSGKIKVSWDKVDGAVEYKVYRATSKNGTYKLVKTTTGTSYTNTSAVAGKTYYYKVVAVAEKSAANSAESTVKSRTCDLARPTVTLTNVASSGKIKVSWDKVDGAVEYKVYRATSKNGTYKLVKTTTGTSYTNTSAVAGKTYYYKVVAVAEKSAANSAESTVKSRTCDLARPDVSITRSNGKPKLTWKAVDGAVEYKIYRATSKNGTYKLIKTTSKTSFVNTGATSGKTYYYKVVAVAEKEAANSAYSSVVYIKAK